MLSSFSIFTVDNKYLLHYFLKLLKKCDAMIKQGPSGCQDSITSFYTNLISRNRETRLAILDLNGLGREES